MKRLLALLLVLVMVFSLVACKKKPIDDPDGTGSGQQADNNVDDEETEWTYEYVENTGIYKEEELETGDFLGTNTEILNNNDLIDPSFAGKKLELYGYSSDTFEDLDSMGKGSYVWMIRAAIDEWAALNKVKIDFIGEYDSAAILGDINAGGHPDIILYCPEFPSVAINGIARAFTDAEYKQLADTLGDYYLDLCTYKGKSYGMMYPWSGGNLFYYNRTAFEQAGVKSPMDYFMEDNWNFDTFEKCMEDIVQDKDGDGVYELYGSGTAFWIGTTPTTVVDPQTGKMTSNMRNNESFKRGLEIMYNGKNVSKWIGAYSVCYKATEPRPATSIGDCEWYNFQHLYQTTANGDVIQVVPVPRYKNDTPTSYFHTPAIASIMTSCDENEMAMSLLTYISRVGMRYMSEFSLGLFKCNYEGIRGASKYAAGWKANFNEIVAARQEEFDAIEDWDQEWYDKLQASVLNADEHVTGGHYPGTTSSGFAANLMSEEASTLPPASSLPILAKLHEEAVANYNNLYAG